MFHMTFPHREMCDSAPCGICAEISEKGILQGEVVKILQMLCEWKKIKNNKRRGVLGLCTYACRDSIERKCTSCIGYQDMKSMRNGSISTGSIVATEMPSNLLAMVILICPSYR